MHFSKLKTPGGFVMGEVRSALQKDIRRGNEREALFWASEIDLAGYGGYLFRVLRLIASEDVGLAWPTGPVVIKALHETFLEVRKEENGRWPPHNSGGMTYLAHAVMLLCRAPKSRAVDNACAVYWVSGPKYRADLGIEIPDYALDAHTARGRSMGRTEDSTYEESYRIENEHPDVPDPYAPLAAKVERWEPGKGDDKNEHRRLMRALHVAYKQLDDQFGGEGTAREWALKAATRKCKRRVTSSADLTNEEARWLLAKLDGERGKGRR